MTGTLQNMYLKHQISGVWISRVFFLLSEKKSNQEHTFEAGLVRMFTVGKL